MLKPKKYRKDILEKEQQLKIWISEGKPKVWICKQLKCHYATLDNYLKLLNLDYKGNQGRKGLYRKYGYISAMHYIDNDLWIGSNTLKKKLFREGIKERKCEKCGNTEWLGGKIPLELHHIDGNNTNNKLSNLKILCPNCHALEENNSGAANKKDKK